MKLSEWILRDQESSRWFVYAFLCTEREIKKYCEVNGYAEFRPTGREFTL